MAGECSYSDSGTSSHSRTSYDKVDMKVEEGVSNGSISNCVHHIPFDLTVQILTRLPPNSLKRFECVSKEWLSTIRNQGFIDSFNSMSYTRFLVAVRNADNRVFLLSSSHNETERSTTYLVNPEMRTLYSFLVDYVYATSLHTNLEMTMSGLLVDLVHCSSVHGFIGLSHPSDPGRFTVCNPSTRQVITLPDVKAPSGGREGVYMYLGYDPVGNEYKALCSTVLCSQRRQEHKVLTLNGGGNLLWRDIKGKITPRYNVVTNGICINGMVYYVGMLISQEKQLRVFCFDIRGERMSYNTPPSHLITRGSLINYNCKLGAAYPVPNNHVPRFNILVLDLDRGMWLKKEFCFSPMLSELSGRVQLKILGRNKTNELILGPRKLPPKNEPLYIFFYNVGKIRRPVKELIRRVKLEGFEEFGCSHTDDDEKCVCQVIFSPEHFESLVFIMCFMFFLFFLFNIEPIIFCLLRFFNLSFISSNIKFI